jgi:ClpP class serine protease
MSRASRIKIIQKIERKRGSKVISYITSDKEGLAVAIASDIISIIHNHILALKKADDIKLDLFIYSRGGQSDVPWAIVSMFREYAKKGSLSILIPYRAHSAATVIALGADEIIMTKKAELGPIDITMGSGPYNPTEKDSHQRLPISVED